ncbi:hypothetical protein CVT24_009379 [Panaeolus cyanescens]|uniref:Uncharacterized protein n=1 Tax=Panaeolus cyanescens TaxID=181874 RepID=A0A409VDJ9_9AGAR|nr:hypothetical protein CVT24_009379 [Panaeolus cyanescens]
MPSSPAHASDVQFLVRNSMNMGYQWASILVPPVYIALTVSRKGGSALSLNRSLRATWAGGLSGAALTGTAAYLRYDNSTEDSVRAQRITTAYDTSALRRNDHATIGGLVSAVLVPAIFWKRANVVNLILGGAGIGTAVGCCVHYAKLLSGDVPAKVDIVIPGPKSDSSS